MKAAVLTGFRQPLEVRDVPVPVPGPADALIRVTACGICRSDWHLWQQDWTWLGIQLQLPHVLGHEFGGVVEQVGRDVKTFKPGDRVTVPFHLACGNCEYCNTGRMNICQAFGFIGVHHAGGYGEYSSVPNADVNLVALPDSVDPVTAASLGCRYMTSYHGIVDRAKVRPGEWVVVIGIGGVGLAAIQIANALGARVVAVSRSNDKLAKAREEGAVETVVAGDSAVATIREITGGGAHVSVDAYGGSITALPGILSLRKGGRHLQLGATGKEDSGTIAIPSDVIMLQELSFIGSVGCPTSSYPGLLSMVSTGTLKPQRLIEEHVDAGDVSDTLARMSDFATTGFNVITSWQAQPVGV